MSDLHTKSSAASAGAALQKEWTRYSQKLADQKKGRAPVALGWSDPRESKPQTSPASELRMTGARVVGGTAPVVAPQVVLGGVALHARFPDSWDVNVYQSATLGSTFAGFVLPEYKSVRGLVEEQIKARTGETDETLTQSPVCLIDGDSRIRRAMGSDDMDVYVELFAEVTTQIALDNVARAAGFASSSVVFAGSIPDAVPVTVKATFEDGSTREMTLSVGQDPKILDEGAVAILHIVLLRRSGAWHLIATRSM